MAKAKKKLHLKINVLPIILFIILSLLAIFTYQIILADKYYPFTFVGDTNISFLTQGRAIQKVEASLQKRTEHTLQFSANQGSFAIDLATASAKIDYSALDQTANHKNQIQTLFFKSIIYPNISLSLGKQLDNIATAVYKEPQNAQLLFNDTSTPEGSPSAHIQIKAGFDGFSLDKKKIQKEITDYILTGKYHNTLPVQIVSPKVTIQQVQRAKQALESSESAPVKLIFNHQSWLIDTKQLLTLLDLTSGENLLLDKNSTYSYLNKIALEIDQNVQEGLFEFNPATKRVSAFTPSEEGRKLDLDKTYQMMTEALGNASRVINLPVTTVKPKIQTSDVNSLGIKELLGRGISNFAGSIPNRIYNVNLTAQKINGILIPPGEIFSFNQNMGDISEATGFKQAYVIKEGRTVLDDGGGVCQDSTTLFRAVLNAGLPVVKRTAHAYRVGYYEQGFPPGLDATIFYPSVDFQFKNDTPAHILIQAYTSGLTLYVDLYGTADGRITSLTTPVVTNQTPPPPELRQDDPSLPKGTVKQVDFPAWGATVTFSRTVIRGSETLLKETFKSSYKAWQAVYLIGTQ